jgi:hypothetical protein
LTKHLNPKQRKKWQKKKKTAKKVAEEKKTERRYEHPEVPMKPDEKKAFELYKSLGKGGYAEMQSRYPNEMKKLENYRQRVRYKKKKDEKDLKQDK